MAKFRKKPVVIEAVRWHENRKFSETPDWLIDAISKPPKTEGAVFRWLDDIRIFTKEGVMQATPGDYIIRGVKGELYPCKPDIFEATHDPA